MSAAAHDHEDELPDPDGDEVIADPYPFYRALRDEHPVHRHPRTGEYILTRFADVQAAAGDPVTFSSEVQAASHDHMASMDPPRHDRHRASVARLFHVRRIADLQPDIEARAAALLAPLADTGVLDVGSEVAAVLPSHVITALVGIPDELREPFRRLALSITTLGGTAAVYQAIADLQGLARQAVEGYALPEDGILARLVAMTATPASELTMADAIGVCTNLVLAGTDTATNLITTIAVFLSVHPDIRRRLVADRQLVAESVEEMLRLDAPVQWLSRRTTRAVSSTASSCPPGPYCACTGGSQPGRAGHRSPG